uniref:Uncharacterized protein n=1 Tax=Candidozyma auris TaxID=498019 RepID=A0A0L0P037_CANAR
MLWGSFKYAVVPLMVFTCFAICASLFLLPIHLDVHQNVMVLSILTLLIPATSFLASAVKVRSPMLPEEPPEGFWDLFWLPLLLEAFKFFILLVASRIGGLQVILHHAITVATILLTFATVLTLLNTPYTERLYKKFYHYKSLWEDCCRNPLPVSKIMHKGSVTSLDSSESTLTNEAPQFSLDSFSSHSSKTLQHAQLMPIFSNSLQSHLDLLDQVYSVSPKNTLHVNSTEEPFEYDTGSHNPYDSLSRLKLFNAEILAEEVDPLRSVEANLETDSRLCHGSTSLGSLRSQELSFQEATSDGSSASSMSSRNSFLHWLHWLFPFSTRQKSKAFRRRVQRLQIKQKFSTYSLNNDNASLLSSNKSSSFGTIDLESQTPVTSHVRKFNCHDFYAFSKFSNANLDVWWSPTNLVDPVFQKFGVTFEEMSTFFFIAHIIELILAQFVSLFTLALPFIASILTSLMVLLFIVLMFVCHLFCTNFLKVQSECSYKINILLALLLRVCTFVGLVVVILL